MSCSLGFGDVVAGERGGHSQFSSTSAHVRNLDLIAGRLGPVSTGNWVLISHDNDSVFRER